ncbi:TPA: hypothetical protein LZ311_004061 [Enterobacter asburiae]|nr:hypothetical protein [Enterobacter asburiae]
MKRTPTADRLRKTRQRLEAAIAEDKFAADKPTWFTCPEYAEGVALFRKHVGDPMEIFGDGWEDYFCPFEAFIEAWQDEEMRAEFRQHQEADAREFDPPSWSFGHMVARQHIADNGAAYSGIE